MPSQIARCLASFLVAASTLSLSAQTYISTVDSELGRGDDAFATGQLVDSFEVPMATWNLSTTVSETDFQNIDARGGDAGLQYTMYNPIDFSTDSNIIRFSVDSIDPGMAPAITISQSVYTQGGLWNGGIDSSTQFVLTWDDAHGAATVTDPDNQLLDLSDADQITSPALIRFTTHQLRNNEDTWSIALPPSAAEAELDWSAIRPNDGTRLRYEWVSFNTDFVPHTAQCEASNLREAVDLFYSMHGESVIAGDGFDYDGDGTITANDMGGWLADVNGTCSGIVQGDTDFDRDVDSTDLGILLNQFGATADSPARGVGWAGGDLNMSGSVDSTDLGILLNNFRTSSSAVAVPEPDSIVLFTLGLLVCALSLRSSREDA